MLDIIDAFFEKERLEAEMFPKQSRHKRNSRKYLRNAFFRKEKNAKNLEHRRYGYYDNRNYVTKHSIELLNGQEVHAHGIDIEILDKTSDFLHVLVKNSINNTESEIRMGKVVLTNGKTFWKYYHPFNRKCCNPVYYKKSYGKSQFAKNSANRAVRRARFYDDEGEEYFYPKGNLYKKLYDSWQILDW